MKKIILSIALLFIILSCTKNEYEKELIGTWNNFPLDGRTNITFKTNSVVSYDNSNKRSGTWKADASKIYIFHSKEIPGLNKNDTLYYKLSMDKNSLMTKTDTMISDLSSLVLLRVKDYWSHYLKGVELEIELPKANFGLIRNDSIWNGVDLYVAYQNDSLAIKNNTGYQLDLLKELRLFINSERSVRQKEDIDNYNLIVDKDVSELKVDSIKKILKVFRKMKIFRVFKNDAANYGKYDVSNGGKTWNWYGRYE